MARSTAKEREGLPAPVVWGLIVLAIILVLWVGFRSMGPDSTTREGIQKSDFLTEMARKGRGQLSNLSTSEQAEVREIAGKDAESTLGNLYSQMPQDPNAELPPAGK